MAQVKSVMGLPPLVLDGKPYWTMIYARCATPRSIDPKLLRSIRLRRGSLGKGDEM
jgi:hypothetical protein